MVLALGFPTAKARNTNSFSQIVSSQRCECFRHAFARRSYGCEKFAIILSRALKPNHHLGFEKFENTVERISKTRFRFGTLVLIRHDLAKNFAP
jgi:hypothetical protein